MFFPASIGRCSNAVNFYRHVREESIAKCAIGFWRWTTHQSHPQLARSHLWAKRNCCHHRECL